MSKLIRVKEETYKELCELGKKLDSFDDIIQGLLMSLKLGEKWQRHWKGHEGENAVWCSECMACYPETNLCEHLSKNSL